MIRRPPRSTLDRSSAASDVYKRQDYSSRKAKFLTLRCQENPLGLSLIHISEPTRLLSISYAVFCLKKKKKNLSESLNNYVIDTAIVTGIDKKTRSKCS